MARYYFNFRDGDSLVRDDEGLELPDVEAVQNVAIRALTDIARDEGRAASGSGDARDMEIEVRNDDGPVLYARFRVAIGRLH